MTDKEFYAIVNAVTSRFDCAYGRGLVDREGLRVEIEKVFRDLRVECDTYLQVAMFHARKRKELRTQLLEIIDDNERGPDYGWTHPDEEAATLRYKLRLVLKDEWGEDPGEDPRKPDPPGLREEQRRIMEAHGYEMPKWHPTDLAMLKKKLNRKGKP